jgi:hypothetical protein
MLPYKVTQKYEALIQGLRDAGTSADCGDVAEAKPIAACFQVHAPGDVVLFECALYLKQWKWKGVSGKERVNILVQAREKIRREDQVLLTSVVAVNYFEVPGGELLQAFHFDYDPAQADHPLFHMQVTNRCIELSPAYVEQLEIKMPPEPAPAVLRCARIPTCDMTFASVLLCLTADHVGGPIFAEFLERVCDLQQNMPQPDIGKLSASLGAGVANVRSSHWFRHLPPQA